MEGSHGKVTEVIKLVSVTVAADNKLTTTNAQIVATSDVILVTDNNLTLTASQNTYDLSQSNSINPCFEASRPFLITARVGAMLEQYRLPRYLLPNDGV